MASLKAKDYVFIDGDNLCHLDAVIGSNARCYTTYDIMKRFEKVEKKRGGGHMKYRAKVRAFVKKLPFKDGCPQAWERDRCPKSSEP